MSTETCASPTAEMMVWCVSSLRLTDMVGSASQAFSRKVLSLSSSLRLTARMATWLERVGEAERLGSILPVVDSVSPVAASSLGTTMMSPASAL